MGIVKRTVDGLRPTKAARRRLVLHRTEHDTIEATSRDVGSDGWPRALIETRSDSGSFDHVTDLISGSDICQEVAVVTLDPARDVFSFPHQQMATY